MPTLKKCCKKGKTLLKVCVKQLYNEFNSNTQIEEEEGTYSVGCNEQCWFSIVHLFISYLKLGDDSISLRNIQSPLGS